MAGSSISVDQKAPPPSSAIFFSLLVPALILWYIYWRLSRRRLYALAEKIPGPEGLPIIGNALDLMGTSHSKLSLIKQLFETTTGNRHPEINEKSEINELRIKSKKQKRDTAFVLRFVCSSDNSQFFNSNSITLAS